MSALASVDDHAAWGARSDDPRWYNRKQVIQFGVRVYPTPYGRLDPVHFECVVFAYNGTVIDADGREYASIPDAVCHFADLHGYSIDDMAVGVAIQGSPLGRRAHEVR